MSNLDSESRAVLEVVQTVTQSIDRQDRPALLAVHYQGPEATAILAGAAEAAVGWPAVQLSLDKRLDAFSHCRTTTEGVQLAVLGELAIVTCRQRIQGRIHDIEFVQDNAVTYVLIRKDHRWLVLHYHASDVTAP